MSEGDPIKTGRRLAMVVGLIAAVAVVAGFFWVYSASESNASNEQLDAIRTYLQIEQGAKESDRIKELAGEEKKQALKTQAARIKELGDVPIQSARIRGMGLERIARVEFRSTPDGPLELRYFTMNILVGKWMVVHNALESDYFFKVW